MILFCLRVSVSDNYLQGVSVKNNVKYPLKLQFETLQNFNTLKALTHSHYQF